MPRHLTGDAHGGTAEIPTVPIYNVAKPQPRERVWIISGEDPVELDASPCRQVSSM